MAQHDYVIDNQSFPATRTDINNVLLAISSTNSGTSAPSTTYANQLWYDTSANKLYIRNEDNDAWIPLFLLDQSNDVAGTLATEIDVEDASGTDTAGTALTIKGGAGTGTGAGGSIIFQTADGAGSTGSSVNAHVTVVTITDDGKVGIGTDTPDTIAEIRGANPIVTIRDTETSSGSAEATLRLAETGASDSLGAYWDIKASGGSLHFIDNWDEGGGTGTRVTLTDSGDIQIPISTNAMGTFADSVGEVGSGNFALQVTNTAQSALKPFGIRAEDIRFATGSSERMRIDSSGNVLVGHTGSIFNNINATSTVGTSYSANGEIFACSSQSSGVMILNRKSTDGDIASFRKDGTTVGTIASSSGSLKIDTGGDFLSFFSGSANREVVWDAAQTGGTWRPGADNTSDIGYSARRWDDIFATNGTIQTSDQNEKQDIASLTSAEITAAKAISKLFKTFKWKDKVASKGDSARTHAGVIAQEVQSAMTDAGLDATKYAFWCSDTWWETRTEVPAVEAVEAKDAVYDDGELVSEAVEAVEAQDAYTRTDTYDTAEEAPEGATERTRLGIRYPELLAFIGAATEQRLADIETRLTALEG